IDVAVGAIMTGVIGAFIVVACAATLHVRGIDIHEARDAAVALEPLAGAAAATLFGLGFVGAALLAAAIVPLSTAYSVCEGFDAPVALPMADDPPPPAALAGRLDRRLDRQRALGLLGGRSQLALVAAREVRSQIPAGDLGRRPPQRVARDRALTASSRYGRAHV